MKHPKLLAVAAFVIIALCAGRAKATEVGNARTFGLGFALGRPSSLVGKVFVGPGNAIDFGIGSWSSGYGRPRGYCGKGNYCDGYDNLGVHADYLWQENLVNGSFTLDWHIGVGGRMWLYDGNGNIDNGRSASFAARMPVGLDFMFSRPSFLELFIEAVPSLYVVPGIGFDVETAVGARFYF